MSKRYYWLKLNQNFFEREEVKVIEDMPNGKDYIIFYLKLLLKSINTEGELLFRGIIPYTPEMLSSITDTDIDTVRVATELFNKLDLIEVWDNGTLFMTETQKMIGSESSSAKRVRKHRAKQAEKDKKALHCNDGVTKSNTEIDIEKEIDKDNKHSPAKAEQYADIIDYLNKKTGKNFKTTTVKTKSLIDARINEGFTVDDFKKVINNKTKQWKTDEEMNRYLRPDTLFSNKFEGYLNEKGVKEASNNPYGNYNVYK